MARNTWFQESAINVVDGVIRGAKLLGFDSRNGRRYESKALKDAKPKYEGKKVYVDHPASGSPNERKFNDWAGVIENVRYEHGKGLFGDVVLRQESAHFAGIVEAANNPKFNKSCGFSHVAEGESRIEGDTEIIESIKEVFSVDLVTDPATTAGFYESTRKPSVSLKEVVESLPEDHALRARLLEMMDSGYMDGGFSLDGGSKADQPTDQQSQLTAILHDAIAALSDSLKALAKASKPDPVIAPTAGGPPSKADGAPSTEEGGAEGSEEEDMSDDDKEKIAAFESLKRENAELQASKRLLESGREATQIRMKALASCATDEEREELLESWPTLDQSGRPSHSPALIESGEDFPRDNPEKFAALLR